MLVGFDSWSCSVRRLSDVHFHAVGFDLWSVLGMQAVEWGVGSMKKQQKV